MSVQSIKASLMPTKRVIKKAAPKSKKVAEKLAEVTFSKPKVRVSTPVKAGILASFSGGNPCVDSFTIEGPDLYSC